MIFLAARSCCLARNWPAGLFSAACAHVCEAGGRKLQVLRTRTRRLREDLSKLVGPEKCPSRLSPPDPTGPRPSQDSIDQPIRPRTSLFLRKAAAGAFPSSIWPPSNLHLPCPLLRLAFLTPSTPLTPTCEMATIAYVDCIAAIPTKQATNLRISALFS